MKSARSRPMKIVRKVNMGSRVPQDLIANENLIKPPHLAHNSLSPPKKMCLQKKRLLEQESSTVKKNFPSLATDCVMKIPVVQLYNLKSELEHQNKKQDVKKPDWGPLSDQGRQDLIVNENLIKPPHLAHNSLSPPKKMCLQKKRLLEQESSTVKKNFPSLATDCVMKIPVVQLYNLKSELEHQNKKQDVKKPDWGPLSDQGRQENRPDDGSVRSKLSPSSLAHNELLPSNIHFTNNPHHQQQNTIENSVYTSNSKECLKVPVVRLFRFDVQPETQEEESTNVSDREQHHNQEHQKTDQQEGPHGDISYTSLEAICKEKQPVVQLYRLDTQPDCREGKQLSKLDSEHNSDQVPSPNNSDASDGMASSSPAQNACLPPRTDVRRKRNLHKSELETICLKQPIVQLNRLNIETKHQLVRQFMDERDNERQHDHVQPPDDSLLNMQPESPKEQFMNDSDSDQFDEEDLKKNISEYELERLKNIKENSKFLNSLKLLEVASNICRPRKRGPYVKRAKIKNHTVMRRSMRLQGVEASPGDNRYTRKWIILPERPDIPPGPIKMFPSNNVDHGAWKSFQDTWKSISKVKFAKPTSFKCRKLTSYAKSLQSLTLEKRAVTRMTPSSVSSLAIHPSNTRTLVATGNIFGDVGLWDLKHQLAGVYQFQLHSSKIVSVAFSPSNSTHLLSLGQEGSIRCGDLTHSVFDEIYHEPGKLTSFDFLSSNGSVLIVSHRDSKLSVVDRRTKTNTYDVRGCLDLKNPRFISVHPLKRDYCVVAGKDNVLIYDVRKLSKDLTQPVMGLLTHEGTSGLASFSPCTGKHILTCSHNTYLRLFSVEHFDRDLYPVKVIRFDRTIGIRASIPVTWDPKQENCFAEGIIVPGKINFTHVKEQCVHTLSNTYFPIIPTALAIHPTRNLVVAGTKGYVCVWKKWKKTLDPPEENKSLD